MLVSLLFASFLTPIFAPDTLESSQAVPNTKSTICHRTHSVTNPYRMITISQSAASSGHNPNHTGGVWTTSSVQGDSWGDIIPDNASGGPNNKELNWTAAGIAIWNGTTMTASNGAACKKLTLKAYYDGEVAAGYSDTQIVTDLNEGISEGDKLLLKTLPGSPTSFTTSNLAAAVTASQAIAVTTSGATSVSVTSPWQATLNGSLKADSTSLTCVFEYDTNGGFPNSSFTATQSGVTNATTN